VLAPAIRGSPTERMVELTGRGSLNSPDVRRGAPGTPASIPVQTLTLTNGGVDDTEGVTEDSQREKVGVRPLTRSELTLLDALLGHEFHGVHELRVQARQVRASPGCICGCGTLELHVPNTVLRSSAGSPVPVEGTVVGADGEPIGGLLLFLDDGRLSALEVYSLVDDPLPMPLPERVRW
jgi:hypothetical protein